MSPLLTELLEKKLILVTGKGGTGKSLLSLALAHRLNSQGKRVWLVELGRKRDASFTRLPELLGLKAPSHKPVKVKLPGTTLPLELSVLDPTTSLAEYVDLKLPTGGLAGVLLNNRITASFLEVVPGLPDLVSLGKLWHAVTEKKEGPDVIVLDAPATGHALSLLRAPANFKRITKMGPVYKDASAMTEFFSDPALTAIALATLPEEMSLQETVELKASLKKEFPRPTVFVNRCFPELPPARGPDNLPFQAYAYSRKRAMREQEALGILGHHPYLKVPFLFPGPKEKPLYLRISEALE